MIKLDKLGFAIPTSSIDYKFDYRYFKETTNKGYNPISNKVEEYKSYSLRNELLGIGFNSCRINESNCTISISGKVVKDKYYDMINKNNFTAVLEGLKVLDIFKIEDIDTAIKNMRVMSFDTTTNMKLKNPVNDYITALRVQNYKDNISLKAYNTGDIKTGLTFINENRTSNDRCIVYDKQAELYTLKNRKQPGDKITDYVNINDFSNVLRFETNFRKMRTVKDFFKLRNSAYGYNVIDKVLEYPKSINYEFYKSLQPNRDLFFNIRTGYKSIAEANKFEGIEKIYLQGGGELDKIYDIYAIKLGKVLNKYHKQRIRESIIEWKQRDPVLSSAFSNVKEFEQVLKVSWGFIF